MITRLQNGLKAVVAGFALLSSGLALADFTIHTARGEVTFKEHPKKVAVYDLGTLDTLDALGVTVAGVPENKYLPYLDGIRSKGKKIGTIFEPNYEKLHALKPDLVIVAERTAKKFDEMSKMFTTIDTTINQQDMFNSSIGRLWSMGKLFNKEEEAQKIEDELIKLRDDTRAAVKGKGNALLLMVNGGKVSSFGSKSRFGWVHSVLDIPSADKNILYANHGQPVSFEFINKTNPDWLIVLDRGAAINKNEKLAKDVLDNALVRETTAWKKNQIIYLSPAAYLSAGGVNQIRTDFGIVKKAFEEAK